jgi:hypothetical protein
MSKIPCGCCNDPAAKLSPVPHTVNGLEQPVAYCRDHWIQCFHSAAFDPPGSDWDSDEPQYIANEARYGAEWDALA